MAFSSSKSMVVQLQKGGSANFFEQKLIEKFRVDIKKLFTNTEQYPLEHQLSYLQSFFKAYKAKLLVEIDGQMQYNTLKEFLKKEYPLAINQQFFFEENHLETPLPADAKQSSTAAPVSATAIATSGSINPLRRTISCALPHHPRAQTGNMATLLLSRQATLAADTKAQPSKAQTPQAGGSTTNALRNTSNLCSVQASQQIPLFTLPLASAEWLHHSTSKTTTFNLKMT